MRSVRRLALARAFRKLLEMGATADAPVCSLTDGRRTYTAVGHLLGNDLEVDEL